MPMTRMHSAPPGSRKGRHNPTLHPQRATKPLISLAANTHTKPLVPTAILARRSNPHHSHSGQAAASPTGI